MAFSITKENDITLKCRELAEDDNRSVSNYLEILVKREALKKERLNNDV